MEVEDGPDASLGQVFAVIRRIRKPGWMADLMASPGVSQGRDDNGRESLNGAAGWW